MFGTVIIFTFIFGIFQCNETGMRPAIKDSDLIVYYRLDKQYKALDTLVVEYRGKKQVRRVIGVAGDIIDITDKGFTVNGTLQEEVEIYQETLPYEEGIRFPVRVEEGQVFLLGDNRESAIDSRIYGAVDIKNTLGKVITIIRRRDL